MKLTYPDRGANAYLFGLLLSRSVVRIQGIPQTAGKLPQGVILRLPLHGAKLRGYTEMRGEKWEPLQRFIPGKMQVKMARNDESRRT